MWELKYFPKKREITREITKQSDINENKTQHIQTYGMQPEQFPQEKLTAVNIHIYSIF